MRIAGFYAENIASTEFRINYWVQALARLGHDAKFYYDALEDIPTLDDKLNGCDAVIYGRSHRVRDIAALLAGRKVYNYKLIVDADDIETEVPLYNHASKIFNSATGFIKIAQAQYREADGVTTSTAFLNNHVSKFKSDAVVMPNCVNMRTYRSVRFREKESHHRNDIRLYWGGGGGHYDDLLIVKEPVLQLFKEHSNLKLIFGNFCPEWAARLDPLRVFLTKLVPFYAYPKLLAWLCVDIGIAPLVENNFNRAKSHVKYIDYSMARIPGVYQRIDAYTGSVKDGETGFLASTPDEWYCAMKLLITSKEQRIHIGNSAKADVMEHWNIDDWAPRYESWLNSLCFYKHIPEVTELIEGVPCQIL